MDINVFFRSNGTNKAEVNAKTRYGFSLEHGALTQLRKPAPDKEATSNSSPTAHGESCVGSTIGYKDARSVSFDFHIIGSNADDYDSKFELFRSEIVESGYFQMRVEYGNKFYPPKYGTNNANFGYLNFLYQDCQPLYEHLDGLGKFTLIVKEPRPDIRDNRLTGFTNATKK